MTAAQDPGRSRMRLSVVLPILALLLSPVLARAQAVYQPGSSWGIVPPAGFAASRTGGVSFEHPSGAIIVITTSTQRHDRSRMTQPGGVRGEGADQIRIEALTDVEVGGRKGFLMTGQAVNGSYRFITVLAQGETAGTAMAIVPTSALGQIDLTAIRAALFTATERLLAPDEQLDGLPIRLAERDGMRISSILPGLGLVLTDGPEDRAAAALKQSFVWIVAAPGDLFEPGRDEKLLGRRFSAVIDGVTVQNTASREIRGTRVIEARFDRTRPGSVRSGLLWTRPVGRLNIFLWIEAPPGSKPDAARLERIFSGLSGR